MTFKLGIIAGGGNLPNLIAIAHEINGGKCFVAGLEGYVEPKLFENFNYKCFKIGNVGAILAFFKNNGITKIVFAGKVSRPNFNTIQVDFTGYILLAKILKAKILGDDSLLQIITNFIEDKGYEVIAANDLLPQNAISALPKSNKKPTDQDFVDIDLGIKVTQALGNLDIGQAVVVQNGYVVGIEAAEGTDDLIERCSNLRRTGGGVLIKMMKLAQDKRLDIPTIGPQTIELLALHNYSGVAIEKDKVIVVETQKTIDLANQHKIFITEV